MSGPSLVSVVMANRNYSAFLGKALDSAIRQTYGFMEIIVVDGGSTDGSRAIYDSYGHRVRVVERPWTTLAAALNEGIAAASGDYIARLDPDDEWEPVKIKRQIDWVERNPTCALIHTGARHINAKGRTLLIEPVHQYHRRNQLRTLLQTNPVRHSSVMFNRRIIQAGHLRYDPNLPFSEDYDLWFRLFRRYRAAYIDQPLLRFRRHDSNVSIHQFAEQQLVTDRILRHYYNAFALEDFYPLLRRVDRVQDQRGATLRAHCHLDLARILATAGLYVEARVERERAAELSTDVGQYTSTRRLATGGEPLSLHPAVRLLCSLGSRWLAFARRLRRLRRRPSVLALVESPPRLGLSARYRAAQYRTAFRRRGINLRISAAWPRNDVRPWLPRKAQTYVGSLQCARRFWDALRAPLHDAVLIQRELLFGPHLFIERIVRSCSDVLVLDVDDALYAAPSWVNDPDEKRWRADKFGQLAEMVDLVVAGNSDLAIWAAVHNPHIEIVPTGYSAFHDGRARPPAKGFPVIGWIGTWGNLYYLASLRGALNKLARERAFELRIICDPPRDRSLLQFPGVKVRFIRWRKRSAEKEMARFDIGLMPLSDDAWARGKCGFKILQYMAAGIPVVSSPVGMNTEIVDDGITGFLAANEAEWVEALRKLLDSAGLRAAFGAAGRTRLVERYAVDQQGDRLAAAILSAIRQNRAAVGASVSDPAAPVT